MIIGDSNIVRFWQASQVSRPLHLGVPLKSVSCLDTLDSALASVTDELDLVLVSVLTSFVIDEGSAHDVRETCRNVFGTVIRPLIAAAKKSSNVEVRSSIPAVESFL